MIDQLEFNQNQGNLGTTRSSAYTNARSASSSTSSRTSASTSARSGSSSTSRSGTSSSSFLDRLRNTTSRAVQVADQTRQVQERTASSPVSSSISRSSASRSPSRGGSRNSITTVTPSTGRSGVENDTNPSIQMTTGRSAQRASRAVSPEENSDRMHATRYLNEFKELAKAIEKQAFVLTQSQYADLQNIIAQYQANNGDLETLRLMMQYSQLEVEGGRPTTNPMMAAFGDIDSKKAIYIGAGLLGLVLLKKIAKRNDK
ncbi:hypothetical protein PZB74_20845 [Porifericola rhodea]|uniref:hypothetical protein n=1 Tax=Porifericola rhodea TaxID=930972 RepID=UPI0026667C71|nr:hypothetical protein [Porifericola rhodea]WKN31401.1 hypothetical protein PZB74_20845 [Porifericola rhodea]